MANETRGSLKTVLGTVGALLAIVLGLAQFGVVVTPGDIIAQVQDSHEEIEQRIKETESRMSLIEKEAAARGVLLERMDKKLDEQGVEIRQLHDLMIRSYGRHRVDER